MSLQEEHPVACPCCGVTSWVLIDCTLGRQSYVEDCQVCCRPMVLDIETAYGEVLRLDARPEND